MMVKSEDLHGPSEYRVDLAMNFPHGKCGCADYQFRREYSKSNSARSRECKHIKKAKDELAILMAMDVDKKIGSINVLPRARMIEFGMGMLKNALKEYHIKEKYDQIQKRKDAKDRERIHQGSKPF